MYCVATMLAWQNNCAIFCVSKLALGTWTVWLVCFSERTGGKLATFTIAILMANFSYAKVPCCVIAINILTIRVF